MRSEPRRSTGLPASPVISALASAARFGFASRPRSRSSSIESVAHAARIESLLAQIHDARPADDANASPTRRARRRAEGRPIDGLLARRQAGRYHVARRRERSTTRAPHATHWPRRHARSIRDRACSCSSWATRRGCSRIWTASRRCIDATIAFGAETDTDDVTGTVTRDGRSARRRARARGIAYAHRRYRPGSARVFREAGRRPTRLRRGATAATRSQLAPVRVDRARVGDLRAARMSALDATITCGGGTYIRALARDLGRLSDSAAHLACAATDSKRIVRRRGRDLASRRCVPAP